MSDSNPSSQPRPGTQASQPSASHYMPELPYAEELQAMLEGRYLVESFLGQGGMGAVYKGLQLPLKRPVAIKILAKRGDGVEDEFAFEERFKREAYAMAALTHPHIVQVYDCGDAGENWLFISMELVEGGDLSDAIKAGTITPEVALKVIPQICDGLQAAHDRGIVHRDIKPANIFMTKDGRAKVADFGLAKKFDVKSTFVTKTGMGMGTPDYAAPEQYEGVSDIDHRADIYALGVMMYQMITGSLPRGNYKPASMRVAVDPRVDAVLAKAMEPDRAERYQSTGDIKNDLKSIAATPQAASTVTSTKTSAVPSAARPATTGRQLSKPVMRQPSAASAVPMASPSATAPTPEKKGPNFIVIGSISAVVIGLGVMFAMKGSSEPEKVTVSTKTPPPPPSTTSSSVTTTTKPPAPKPTGSAVPLPQVTASVVSVPVPAGSEKWVDGLAQWFGGTKTNGSFAPESNGAVRAGSGFSTISPVPTSTPPFRDQVARVRVRLKDDSSEFRLIVRRVVDASGKSNDYSARLERKDQRIRLGCYAPGKPFQALVDHKLPSGFDYDAAHTLELRAVGDLLTVMLDGKKVVERRDTQLTEGHPAVGGKNMVIESFEYASLDPGGAAPVLATAPGTAPPAQPGDVLTFGGHNYQLVMEKLTYEAAKARAESMGGHLATISSKEENEWMQKNIVTPMGSDDHVILGARRAKDTGVWAWVTGEPVDLELWGGKGPDGSGAALSWAKSMKRWDDVNPNNPYLFLVEWDDPASMKAAPAAPLLAPAPPLAAPVDLLALIDVKRDAVRGKWTPQADGLLTQPTKDSDELGTMQLLDLQQAAPEEYDFEIEFTVQSGTASVIQILPLPGGRILWKMGQGTGDPTMFGFGPQLDGRQLQDAKRTEASASQPRFKKGQRCSSLVEVRKGSLRALVDGVEIVKWSGDLRRFAGDSNFVLSNPTHAGIACHNTAMVFHKAELRPPGGAPLAPQVATASAVSEMPLPPATAAPSDPRLAQLEAGFNTRYEADAQKPFAAAVASLNQSYAANGIARARAAAQAKGNLPEVTALDAEKVAIESGNGVPAEDAADAPESLKTLRGTYRSALAKLTTERDAKAAPLYDLYAKALDAYIAELTKADKIEDAQKVKALRESIAAKGGAGSAPSSTPASGSAPTTPSASATPSAAAPKMSERDVAEWVIATGGNVTVNDGRSDISVSEASKLPSGRFSIHQMTIKCDKVPNQDLSPLASARDAWRVHLQNNLPDRSFPNLAPLREVPKLRDLMCPDLDASGVDVVASLPALTRIALGKLPEGSLEKLAALKNLEDFESASITGASVGPLKACKKLRRIQIRGNPCRVTDEDVRAIVATLPDLEGLHFGEDRNLAPISNACVSSILELKSLNFLSLSGKDFDDSVLESFTKIGKLKTLSLSGSKVTGKGISALAKLDSLRELYLQRTPITDSALDEIARIKSLKRLVIYDTIVSDAAIARLKAALPECKVDK